MSAASATRAASAARLRTVAVGLSWLAAALGTLAFLGWVIDVQVLRTFGGRSQVDPSTAAALIACTAALRLRVAGKHTATALALAAVPFVVGGVALLGFLLDTDAGIPLLLFPDAQRASAATGAIPGATPPATALALALFGVAVAVLPFEIGRGHRPADWFGVAGLVIGLFTLLAYPTHAEALRALGRYTAMSIPTALACLALGSAILLSHPDRGIVGVLTQPGRGASALRLVFPVAVVAPITLELLQLFVQWLGVGDPRGTLVHVGLEVTILATLLWIGARYLDRSEADRQDAEHRRDVAEAHADRAKRSERVAQAGLEPRRASDAVPAIAARVREVLGVERVRIELAGGGSVAAGAGSAVPAAGSRLEAPLRVGSRVLGIIVVERAEGGRFTAHDEQLLELLAVPAALAIDRARLVENEERLLRERAEALERYRTLAELLPVIVWVAGPSGGIEYYNQRWYDYTGLTPETSHGDGWTTAVDPDDLRGLGDLRATWAARAENSAEYELRLRRHDGTYRWHAGRFTLLRDADGQAVRTLGTLIDVDDRKRLIEERATLLERERAARMAAESASRAKDDFLGTLSHELRTPLTPILAWAELLRSDTLPADETHAALESIERSARVQSRLIEDLLDVSAIVAGKLRLEPKPMDLAQSVSSAADAVRPTATGKGVILEVVLDADELRLVGDPARMEQIAWNLLSNAIKFTPRGGTVRCTLQRHDDRAVLEVSDTGQGIVPEFLPYVFDRFRQADSTPGRQHGGLGLGLAIVRHLTELHGGSVRATSAGIGAGSTFTVELPLAAAGEARGAIRPLAVAGESLGGLRVLLVDDDRETVDVMQTLLSLYGAQVEVANSAAEALAVLDRTTVDVLLSDIGMPECDGFELIRRVREREPARGGTLPAIALTAYARPEDRDAVLAAGFQQHLAKPVEPATLVAALEALRAHGRDAVPMGDGNGAGAANGVRRRSAG